jgi:hypothetical protein
MPHLDKLCLQVLLAQQANVLVHHLRQQQQQRSGSSRPR